MGQNRYLVCLFFQSFVFDVRLSMPEQKYQTTLKPNESNNKYLCCTRIYFVHWTMDMSELSDLCCFFLYFIARSIVTNHRISHFFSFLSFCFDYRTTSYWYYTDTNITITEKILDNSQCRLVIHTHREILLNRHHLIRSTFSHDYHSITTYCCISIDNSKRARETE